MLQQKGSYFSNGNFTTVRVADEKNTTKQEAEAEVER